MLDFSAAEKKQSRAAYYHHPQGAHISLQNQKKSGRCQDSGERQKTGFEVGDVSFFGRNPSRHIDDKPQFQKLRGLEEKRPDAYPPAGSAVAESDFGQKNQRSANQTKYKQRKSESPQYFIIKLKSEKIKADTADKSVNNLLENDGRKIRSGCSGQKSH